ncbi:MAG: alkaline phosphatase family protein [Deltaproteobacteria bacterium]|nr:MAG: alkaline phosphatase family protein [Deltaproteobacteria bacterium]
MRRHPCALSGAPIACLFALLIGCGASVDEGRTASVAPRVTQPQHIRHVVVLMMENRSFDHFLGWLPGADGKQAGLAYLDANGASHPTHELAPDFQGCGQSDPDHSYAGGRQEVDGGQMDGWLRAGQNDLYPIGYYGAPDLPFWGQATKSWLTFDRYFPSILSETFPNRIYQHAAQTDRLSNTFTPTTLPTIWDRLAEKGLTGRYYFSDLPFLALWGSKYVPISHPIPEFYADAAAGRLPEVSFVDGEFAQEAIGTGNDDHPHQDVRNGEAFLNSVYEAVVRSPEWHETVLFINFDEWGGFFDHVPPPRAPIPPASLAAGDTDGSMGVRVPAMLVAPWAAKEPVSHRQFEHTSVLRMIEANWKLPPLTMRDARAADPSDELDFSRPLAGAAPRFDVPSGPFGIPCPSEGPGNGILEAWRSAALTAGFPLP